MDPIRFPPDNDEPPWTKDIISGNFDRMDKEELKQWFSIRPIQLANFLKNYHDARQCDDPLKDGFVFPSRYLRRHKSCTKSLNDSSYASDDCLEEIEYPSPLAFLGELFKPKCASIFDATTQNESLMHANSFDQSLHSQNISNSITGSCDAFDKKGLSTSSSVSITGNSITAEPEGDDTSQVPIVQPNPLRRQSLKDIVRLPPTRAQSRITFGWTDAPAQSPETDSTSSENNASYTPQSLPAIPPMKKRIMNTAFDSIVTKHISDFLDLAKTIKTQVTEEDDTESTDSAESTDSNDDIFLLADPTDEFSHADSSELNLLPHQEPPKLREITRGEIRRLLLEKEERIDKEAERREYTTRIPCNIPLKSFWEVLSLPHTEPVWTFRVERDLSSVRIPYLYAE
ncbi:hypothetical protein BDEG_23533 [Batrachochytrium dendrobatidis JEL423]|uniref:Uncharacterized protein n=1 Tax=Batrachochytrium dendrobatidis (strain JEL423) TaxID=403673 RepID=A0A177WJ60_BATDL|nr:hypothetical protein BDEG_23533 [Batrachochytrium dendrobatidis JEL423]